MKFGLLWGGLAFVVGWSIVFILLPDSPLGPDLPRWKQVSWIYLNLNFVTVSGTAVAGLLGMFQEFDFLSGNPQWSALRMVPILLLVIAGILTNESVGHTRRLRHHLVNATFVSLGFVGLGSVLIFVSDARPGFSLVFLLFVVGGIALLIGSRIVGALGNKIPVLAITTIGGLLAIGLVVVLGVVVVIETLIPLIAVSLIGSELGAGLIHITRNV